MRRRGSLRSNFKLRARLGMTLIEMLGVMAVLAILAGIAVGGILSAQNKARVTSALSSIDAYAHAFTTSCILSPGLASDRASNWVSEADYSSKDGLKRLVYYMNDALDDSLDFYWDDSLKCYVSYGTDPWGGNYILTEYPILADGTSYFDPTVSGNEAQMAVAVWATGNVGTILQEKKVDDKCYGVGMIFSGGIVDDSYQGFNGEYAFTDATLKLQ